MSEPTPRDDLGPSEQPEPSRPTLQPPRNDFGIVGLIIGLVAVVISVVTDHVGGYLPGLAGLLFGAIGVGVAARHDVGMARSLAGGLLSLFALAVTLYSMGTTAV